MVPYGMMGSDSMDYWIESPIEILGVCFYWILGCDIQIQVLQTDLNRNTSFVKEAVKSIHSTSHNVQGL